MLRNMMKKSKGQTLIETIAVIAMLIILSTIAATRHNITLDTGKYATSEETARAVCDAQKIYYAKHKYFTNSATLISEEYIRVNSSNWNGAAFIDAWGNPYLETVTENDYSIKLGAQSQAKTTKGFEFTAP